MAFDPSKYGATPIGTFDPSKYNAVPVESAQTSRQSLPEYVWNSVVSAAKSGVEQIKQGEREGIAARNPLQVLESGAKVGAGIVNTAFSPLAPVFAPIGKAVDALAQHISNDPQVQRFATSKAGQVTSRVAEDVANLNTIFAGSTAFAKGAPAVRTKVDTALEARRASNLARDAQQVDSLAAKIIQGKEADIPKAKSVLSTLDTTGVKTYRDFVNVLNEKVSSLSEGLDQALAKRTEVKPLEELNLVSKVGDQTVSHNYVVDALNQLDDLYRKTNDVQGEAIIKQLRNHAETQGLTVKEINDLARLHGEKINAFNASGEAASGLTKQAAENTRSGLKATAREIYNDPIYKAVDSEISKVIRVRDLAEKVAENVQKLQQRVNQRSWGERVGRLAFQVIDTFTGGAVKGFVQSFIPRSAGLKILNALDLERALQNNLRNLQEILNKNLPPNQIEIRLQNILKGQDSDAFLNNQPTNSRAKTNVQNIPKINTIPPELQPLAKEAQKYKSAEDFAESITDSSLGAIGRRYEGLPHTYRSVSDFAEKTGTGGQFGKIHWSQARTSEPSVKRWVDAIKSGERPAIVVREGLSPSQEWIMDGHNRLSAYRQLGFKEVPTITKSQLIDFYNKVKETK